MENIKFNCTCLSLNRFWKRINITLEPNHFAFPEKTPTFKTLLLPLEFSAHQEEPKILMGPTGTKRFQNFLCGNIIIFLRWE